MDGNAQDTPEEDALLVLTAAMLTPGGFPGVLGDDYPAACLRLGLEPLAGGYGLVFGQDSAGARWTVATTDAAMVACALAAWDCGLEYDLSPDESTMVASLPGWPLPVAVAAPGVPAPHDPDETAGAGPALAPPDTSVWGPQQRRLGADEIAIRWREWRDQIGSAAENTADADTSGDAPATKAPDAPAAPAAPESSHAPATRTGTATDTDVETPVPALSHDGVRRALESAEAYTREPPPPGRVRTTYGAVRADGPGWSLVARTDDMAFVLLDDAPGEVLPVGRGPALPPLLEALGRLATAEVRSG
ncbi:hypothetical protein AB0399_04435 [Streptomyces sp. NPDC088194]|uniref:hypothetical protein n=1 Tax=Streptomyces sp. NPDC088194 TaxID=3154931 RepID=UPI00344BD52E